MRLAYFDIHSHLDFPDFDADRDDVIKRMREEGIATITIGTEEATSQKAAALAETHTHIFASVGVHPTHDGATFAADAFAGLLSPRVVAVGECGLDYFRLEGDVDAVKKAQRESFEAQIAFADVHALPLMIHARPTKGTMDAYNDTLDLIEAVIAKGGLKRRGNFHFFAGDVAVARRALDLGFTLSFDGPITFARDYDEVIRFAPLSMIMAETDAPFAAPAPYRGKRNSPLFVPYIVEAIASIRGESLGPIKEAMVQNAVRVFALEDKIKEI